jgi:hypothetical protein
MLGAQILMNRERIMMSNYQDICEAANDTPDISELMDSVAAVTVTGNGRDLTDYVNALERFIIDYSSATPEELADYMRYEMPDEFPKWPKIPLPYNDYET